MKARRALERRRLALATSAAATVGAAVLASRHADGERRPLRGCHASSVRGALASLNCSGVGVVKDVIKDGLLDDLRATAVFKTMPTSLLTRKGHARSHAGKSLGASTDWRPSAMGRWHRREETFNEHDVQVFERVEALIWPLVTAFFQEDHSGSGTQDIYRSEMQVRTAPRLRSLHVV